MTSFNAGDAVFGVTNARFTGTYAEYALAEAAMIGRKPPRLSHVDSMPVGDEHGVADAVQPTLR